MRILIVVSQFPMGYNETESIQKRSDIDQEPHFLFLTYMTNTINENK